MLRPLVLEFTDDIPRSQFWLGFTMDILFGADAYTFRVPEHLGKQAALKRMSLVFGKPEEYIVVVPATPIGVLAWLADHKQESQFRRKNK